MPNDIKFSPPASTQTAMSGELDGLADGGGALADAAIDNAVGLDQFADFELLVTFVDAPGDGGSVSLWLLPALDGVHFADGDASTAAQAHLQVGAFQARAGATAQRLHLRGVVLPPLKFKPLIRNAAGQAFASTGNALRYRTYNDQVQ